MIIEITDNPKEQMEIGKQIFNSNRIIYNSKTIEKLEKAILNHMPNADDRERKSMFFRSIYDYWLYGNNVDEEFFYHFYQKTHTEKITYLTYQNRMPYYDYLNEEKDAHFLNNKYDAYRELKEYYMRDVILIHDENDYEMFKDFSSKHEVFVVKPEDLSLAAGVHKFTMPRNIECKKIFDLLLNEAKSLKKTFGWRGKKCDSLVLEEVIDQDDSMARMHPASVNGVRCTTINIDGKITLYYPWMKIGVNGEFVTGGGVGSLLAGVNAETGEVQTLGFNEKGETYYYHPTSGIEIPGFQIPKWDELKELMQRIAKHFPTIHYTGWDMVLSKKGWCIMEGNYGGECLWQLMYGKGMKADLENLINWRPSQEYWLLNK